jgi:hypothetical protein
MINPLKYEPKGDKKNSAYFNEYITKIYQRRQSSGLEDLIGDMCALIIQVQTGDAIPYIKELYAMMPYRFKAGYISFSHKFYCLESSKDAPALIIMEPLDPNFEDDITRVNKMYPNSRAKCNARYIGEVFKTKSIHETAQVLKNHDFRFYDENNCKNGFFCSSNFLFTRMSNFSYNSIGYTERDIFEFDSLGLGQPFLLTNEQKRALEQSEQFTVDKGLDGLLKGIDHMATRILAGEREDAILEFLCLSNYYFWGAYNIVDMNSSTNVNRCRHGDDIRSPAKVFTANNTPYMVNSFENLPMPTENFVRNYGRRMHHIAIEVVDGDHASGVKNIDYVINTLKEDLHIGFLAKVFGECRDEPDLKQIFSKHSPYSLLITEYVERCHGFDGFFTKNNVAALTEAASLDEEVKAHHKHNPVIGD